MPTSATPRFQFRISTIILLTSVVALTISLFVPTARHNAQLLEMTQKPKAQLTIQQSTHHLQLSEMELRHSQEKLKERGGGHVVEF